MAVLWISLGAVSMFVASGLAMEDEPRTKAAPRASYQMSDASWFYYFVTQLPNNPYLSRELEVIDYQQQRLETIRGDMQAKYNEMMSEYRQAFTKGNYQQAQAAYMDKLNSYKEAYVEQVKKVLLPHQVKRIEQIVRQQKSMYARGTGTSYYSGRRDELDLPALLADELELSVGELEKVRQAAEKSRQKMEQEMKRIKADAVKEVLNALPAAKRQKLAELIGEPYDFAGAQKALSQHYQQQAEKRRQAQAEQAGDRNDSSKDGERP